MKTLDVLMAISLTCGSANAAHFSFTGNFTDSNQVQEFNFAVAATDEVALRTLSYAGGINAEGTTIARGGFDPIVSLFNASTRTLIASNDDGHLFYDPVTGSAYDSFMKLMLSPGEYIATVTQYGSFSNGSLDNGFLGSGSTDFSGRDSHWALDFQNVQGASLGASYVAVPSIPEPETYAMLLAGLGLLGWRMHNARS
jgi:hypothetical protein